MLQKKSLSDWYCYSHVDESARLLCADCGVEGQLNAKSSESDPGSRHSKESHKASSHLMTQITRPESLLVCECCRNREGVAKML